MKLIEQIVNWLYWYFFLPKERGMPKWDNPPPPPKKRGCSVISEGLKTNECKEK